MLNFDFLEKGLEIAWLLLLLEIVVNMCIAIVPAVQKSVCDLL